VATESELVYNRLVADEKLAMGTKYERRQALVYKVMAANAEVVHHVILRPSGKESDHEIDVVVTHEGVASRPATDRPWSSPIFRLGVRSGEDAHAR
jgi:hypothetical protein